MTVEKGAFAETRIMQVHLPSSITEIREGAFRLCPDLVNVVLNSPSVTIADKVFEGCGKLTAVYILGDAVFCGDSVFMTSSTLEAQTLQLEI